jgi:CDP-4-dehydro-6-deoxyglucose reductase
MVLYWGGRRPKDLYMNELAAKWAAEHPQLFKYVPVVSDALPADQWSWRETSSTPTASRPRRT